MKKNSLKIALVGAVHPNMPGDDAQLYRNICEEMKQKENAYGVTFKVYTQLLESEDIANNTAEDIRKEQADFILFFCASLPFGRVVLPFAELGIPLGFWAVPEPETHGVLQLNSFCGLNMLGGIIRNYFPKENIKYKWFYGMPDSAMFDQRFSLTVKALRAIQTLCNARIGQIGDLANGFENLYIDERKLHKQFGTTIQSRHSVEEIVARAEKLSQKRIREAAETVLQEGTWEKKHVSENSFDKFLRIGVALEDFAAEHSYDALAISCWSRFQEVYGIAVCGAMSRLNQQGVAAPCEADVTSALTMLMLNALHSGRASLNDLVSLDESDQSINLWHCGVAPGCWANEDGVKWNAHFNIGTYVGDTWVGEGVTAQMSFAPGETTVCTMDTDGTSFFLLSGEVMEGKQGYYGSSGWVNNLHINHTPVTIAELINTISVCQVNHHYPAAMENLVNEINELAFWKGMSVLEPVEYRPYMQHFRK